MAEYGRPAVEEHDEFEEYRRKSYSAGNLLTAVQTVRLHPPDDEEWADEEEEDCTGPVTVRLPPGTYPSCPGVHIEAPPRREDNRRYHQNDGAGRCKNMHKSASGHIRRKLGTPGSEYSSMEGSEDGNYLAPPPLNRQRSRSLPFNAADFQHLLPPSNLDEPNFACQRVRRFSSGAHGLVNLGDTVNVKKVSSRRNSSEPEEEMTTLYFDPNEQSLKIGRERVHGLSDERGLGFKVLIVGSHGVGKESLTRQFVTSEYVGYMEPSSPTEFYPDDAITTVPVLLNDKEYTIDIVRSHSLQVFQQHPDVDLCLVMYCIDVEESFFAALDVIKELRSWEEDGYKSTTIFLVGNKADLERNRVILPSKAKELAGKHDCKFMEISVALNHQVDELLVRMLKSLKRSSSRRPSLIDCLKGGSSGKKKKDKKGIRGSVSHALGKASSKLMKSCDDLLLIFNKGDK